MKRFIDLRGQVEANWEDLPRERCKPHFAFFCTVVDRFEIFNDTQEWYDTATFIDDYRATLLDDDPQNLTRYLNLIPAWVPVTEDLE